MWPEVGNIRLINGDMMNPSDVLLEFIRQLIAEGMTNTQILDYLMMIGYSWC